MYKWYVSLQFCISAGGQLDTAFVLLHEATNKLMSLVRQEFHEAVKKSDVASIERFFKIFPLLNLHDEGLKKFCDFLCSKVNVCFIYFSLRIYFTIICKQI